MLEHQIRQPEKHFSQEAATDAARHLVVARGRRFFTGDLPQRAARKGVRKRFPVTEARRPRETVIHGALVRVAKLIGLERVAVDDPAMVQIVSDRRQVALVILAVSGMPVDLVQQHLKAEDLERRNDIALARFDVG